MSSYLLIPADFVFEQSLKRGGFTFARFKRPHCVVRSCLVVNAVLVVCGFVVVVVDQGRGGKDSQKRFASKQRQDGKFSHCHKIQEFSRPKMNRS
jgi:hypothetical protein